ncbi:glutamate synthase large subunit [Parasphaerochaeta coccoides]|uniref:Glutamate synthase [NADPH] large chain n=1 Tax=Parasphaerochaeta coccoides (strain ATCC BAA-1237 / DSM 17374 / SPN1) TaxID=760011 RepID=F4GK29_PARC1|nr:glutamate synthase large subunit [Parasphaerochaeta coccoides]AEC01801.1 glutamate synthase (NADH) large subunit [Parasphaerochaeta coccoides DSM 17374]
MGKTASEDGQRRGLYDRNFEHDACGVGVVANIDGKASHEIVSLALTTLEKQEHRGAESWDGLTGDGAGIMIQIPHAYFSDIIANLPEPGKYATGLVFMSQDNEQSQTALDIIHHQAQQCGLSVFSWRTVPTSPHILGPISRNCMPAIHQMFVRNNDPAEDDSLTVSRLYVYRKSVENAAREAGVGSPFHIPSLSTSTIVYKGMMMSRHLRLFYPELEDPRLASAAALVHSRFSTNTFPSWELAQPFRYLAHNGEINTIQGNRQWMRAQQSTLSTNAIPALEKVFPIIEPGKSDSASLDNATELLYTAGRSLPHALMMLVPESFNERNPIPDELRAFYTYSACLMEPWDGPASLLFFDGRFIGGTLDRNGLRPSRFTITQDGMLIMASEAGVLDFPASQILQKGRLSPGKFLLLDLKEHRIIPDAQVKHDIYVRNPYPTWIQDNLINLADLPHLPVKDDDIFENQQQSDRVQKLFNFSLEDRESLFPIMALSGQEPTSSMGTDTPIAPLSQKPQLLFSYFKQLFAQVTNPPIDSIREELVMTLTSFTGRRGNLLQDSETHAKRLMVKNPLLSTADLRSIQAMQDKDFSSIVLDDFFPVPENPGKDDSTSLEENLKRLRLQACAAVENGYTFIILSDRKLLSDTSLCPIPSLLAAGAVHQGLLEAGKRLQATIIVDSGEPREVMHHALLFGFGADLIVPWGAYAMLHDTIARQSELKNRTYQTVVENYQKGIAKALLKIMAKMGIATLRSYRGAQIFEALGLGKDVMDMCFTGCQSRIGGISFTHIQEDALELYRQSRNLDISLPNSGQYRWLKGGEIHAWNPDTIRLLQQAVREGRYEIFREFTASSDKLNATPHVLRGMLEFSAEALSHPIAISDVESVESIIRRFTSGAMSFGSISREAHETIAAAMNSLHARSNSGEGGEDSERFAKRGSLPWTRGAIKQVASARFGVTSNYLANADELQIKIAQGAKPGEGGQLPGHKTDASIARIRHATPGVTLISPPPHHDIYSIEDLAELIYDLKAANPHARIGVKLVSEAGVGTVAAGVAKAHANSILISGYDGGTGASPLSSIRYAGLPWELGLAETHQTLVANKLRERVRLMTDGQLKSGKDVVIAAMLGAEEFGFGTSVLVTLGCVMMRKCHVNTCPMGVATQDPALRKLFTGKVEHIVNFFTFLAQEVREIMASLGIAKFEDMVGRSDLLVQKKNPTGKAATLDLSRVLYPAHLSMDEHDVVLHSLDAPVTAPFPTMEQKVISRSIQAIEEKIPVSFAFAIRNTDRAIGAGLSYEISRRYGDDGLPDNFVTVDFMGSAGQSFGAFLARGVTFRLHGEANDYLGKGLSGGRIIVNPPTGASYPSYNNIIIGNTVLYGATDGEVFVSGLCGERFCVRNSGATAVIEGTGDHCAEYMTGGTLVVLGAVGRNFAAGMSGGIAYVLDEHGQLEGKVNKGMVELLALDTAEDEKIVKDLIRRHVYWTGSTYAQSILDNWDVKKKLFIKVLPVEYKRALQQMQIAEMDRKLNEIRENEDIAARA